MKRILPLFLAVITLTVAMFITKAYAATADGQGPWADSVISTSQGLRKDGSAVPAARSDASSMLGVAEGDTVDGHFYSLGFGGSATLGFENGISNGVLVVEATNPDYPTETVGVEVSEDNITYVNAGTIDRDGSVELPDIGMCVHYVRLTDQSNPANFGDPTADGYDVDGVQAQGNLCTRTGKMTGGGSVYKAEMRVTHGMELRCDGTNSNLQVNWDKGNSFHLDQLTAVLCSDNPSLNGNKPQSLFDTYEGWGTGTYNGTAGYRAHFVFTDNGEPGTKDTALIEIWDPTHTTQVLDLTSPSYLKNGNHQAH